MPLGDLIDTFWEPATPLEGLAASVRPPVVELAVLKRLGPPVFLPDHDLAKILAPSYEAMSTAALHLAYGEAEAPEPASSQPDGDEGPDKGRPARKRGEQ